MNLATGSKAAPLPHAVGVSHDYLPVIMVTLALFGAMLLTYGEPALTGNFPDTDDAMRMVMVDDFLRGQGWFDLTARRLAPPGVVMHWSRLVDLPIAALAGFLSSFLDTTLAERVTAVVWPLMLLAVALLLVNALARRLIGPDGALLALGMLATSFCIWNFFTPGRVDHHNVQLVLGLGFMLGLARTSTKAAAVAGVLAATMATIGIESLPWIVGGTAWLAALWVVTGDRHASALRAYGLAIGLAALALLFVSRGSGFLVQRCDSLSIVHATTALCGGGAFVLLSFLRGDDWRLRATSLMAAGFGVLGIAYGLFPQCAAGPYAELPSELVSRWLSGVGEARSLPQVIATDIGMMSQYTVASLGALSALRLAFSDPARGREWSLIATVATVLLIAGLFQVRAVLPAAVLATLPIASVFHGLKTRFVGPIPVAVLFLAGLTAGSTFVQTAAINTAFGVVKKPSSADYPNGLKLRRCWTPEAIEAATGLPAGLVLAPIDLGPRILYFTPHSVLGAPYHRNTKGNLAVLDAFAASQPEAERDIRRAGIGYVFYCHGQPTYGRIAQDSFRAALELRQPPDWLIPVPYAKDPALEIFKVAPERRSDDSARQLPPIELRGAL